MLDGFQRGAEAKIVDGAAPAVHSYDFTAANSVVMPIAVLLMKCAFLIMAVALNASGGDYTMPYLIFIGIDIVGMILILCVTNKCKGKVD